MRADITLSHLRVEIDVRFGSNCEIRAVNKMGPLWVSSTQNPAARDAAASRAFLDAALAQIGEEAGEDRCDVRCRRRRDIDLPRWGEG
jgi:hypothetical protein